MKRTNEEILLIFQIMNNVIKVSNAEELKPFSYAFIKNKMKFKTILETNDEFVKTFSQMYKTENIEELEKIASEDEGYNKFLKEENDIELYTIKLDSLEGKEFNLLAVDALVGNIIEE